MNNYGIIEHDDHHLIIPKEGKVLGIAKNSDLNIIKEDGLYFKDLNGNGILDPYEDWRIPVNQRISNLVSQMSVEQMAGLMLYSSHQSVATDDSAFSKMYAGTYGGKTREESGASISDITDQQKSFLKDDHLRHVLMTTVDSAEVASRWNNNLQAFAESLDLGIPVTISSDPRHAPKGDAEYNAGAGGDISLWPEPLGLAATFDKDIVYQFGQIAALEYRKMGITTALSPQIDIATDPRWMRFNGTFGEDSTLSSKLAQAYCDGFQTTVADGGWGTDSVNVMVKHWPGGGSGESGRDGHYDYGKYAVYPGNNFDEHLIPFTKGAFNLKGGTLQAASVMPYYTISVGQDTRYHEEVGNGFSKYIIQDLLREEYEYEGVVCTDWGITGDCEDKDSFLSGKSWGVDALSIAERHYKVLMAGVDQFGGNNDLKPVLEAYEIGCQEHGEDIMRRRFELSASRLLNNIFRPGLFENPYTDNQHAKEVVGNHDFMQKGYQAQLKSIIMLKNKNKLLPLQRGLKVFIPKRYLKSSVDWFGREIPEHEEIVIDHNIVNNYFNVVDDPKQADFALCMIESPHTIGYTKDEGYLPLSLQYQSYRATKARKESLASDDNENRSYYEKENIATNSHDLDMILETKQLMGDKPVVAILNAKNPTIVKEFEEQVDALLVHFNVQNQAILDVLTGEFEPNGLLPFQMPKNMETVELQDEDVAHDMECHKDCEGNLYDFAFGMNFKGIINDDRVKTFKKVE